MAKAKDLKGMRFGKLVALERAENDKNGVAQWLCQCDCGNQVVVRGLFLSNGHTTSCGCRLNGKRYGTLTAIRRTDKYIELNSGKKGYYWELQCDCGEIVYRTPQQLLVHANCSCDKCRSQRKAEAMTKLTGSNKSGVRGVSFNKKERKWCAFIFVNRKNVFLGEYTYLEDAIKARKDAVEKYYGPGSNQPEVEEKA